MTNRLVFLCVLALGFTGCARPLPPEPASSLPSEQPAPGVAPIITASPAAEASAAAVPSGSAASPASAAPTASSPAPAITDAGAPDAR